MLKPMNLNGVLYRKRKKKNLKLPKRKKKIFPSKMSQKKIAKISCQWHLIRNIADRTWPGKNSNLKYPHSIGSEKRRKSTYIHKMLNWIALE